MAYINGIGFISPHDQSGSAVAEYNQNPLGFLEPDYKAYIKSAALRKIYRIVKAGIASAKMCIAEAELEMPDGIITGTAYGCLENTDLFLKQIVENKEQYLNPTLFITSTHNAIGSHIAMQIGCQNYNMTYTQRSFSFESALLDTLLMLKDGMGSNYLCGGIDEVVETYAVINQRFGRVNENLKNTQMASFEGKGTILGEGAVYFCLSAEKKTATYAEIIDTQMNMREAGDFDLSGFADALLKKNNLDFSDIDLLISGRNGDTENDTVYAKMEKLFPHAALSIYKNICGEYKTSSAQAVWLAARALKNNALLEGSAFRSGDREFTTALIYNHYQNKYHSFILLRKA